MHRVARESDQANAKRLFHLLPCDFLLDFSAPPYKTSKKNGPVFGFQLILSRFWRSGDSGHGVLTADSALCCQKVHVGGTWGVKFGALCMERSIVPNHLSLRDLVGMVCCRAGELFQNPTSHSGALLDRFCVGVTILSPHVSNAGGHPAGPWHPARVASRSMT